MKRTQAHELLNAARAGCNVSPRDITEALRATGDICQGWRGNDDEADDDPSFHVWTPVGAWEKRSKNVLAPAHPFDGITA